MRQSHLSSSSVLTFTLALALILPPPVAAGGRRYLTAASAPFAGADELSITFVDVTQDGRDAVLDTGRLQERRIRGERRTVTTRVFGIRLGALARESRGTASLRASVDPAACGCEVRVDGVVLGPVPRPIALHLPVGIVTQHRLEVSVSVTSPEGPVQAQVEWQATTE